MGEACHNVLVVEDSDADARLIETILTGATPSRFEVGRVVSLNDAIRQISEHQFDLIVLDLSLPDSSGLDTFMRLQSAAQNTPVVVVSGIGEESTAVEAVKLGAQDYLAKNQINSQLLPRSLRYAIERHRLHESLRGSEERFRQLTESMREVFWLHDVDEWRLLYVSPAYESIWGRDRKPLYASYDSWVEAIHTDDRKRLTHAIRNKVMEREFSEQYRIVRPDGSIRWIWDRGVPIRNDRGEVYRVAGIAEDITERRKLEREVLEASAREQLRISRDLHDTVGQELTGLGFLARTLSHKLREQESAEAELAEEIATATQGALAEVRNAIRGLTPVELDAHGLMVALEQLTSDVHRRVGIPCDFICDRPSPVENNDVATHLFRIAQESVNNAVKHAQPKSILVRLEAENGEVMLQVADDGTGMNVGDEPTEGMGLSSMHYRANAIGATLDVASNPSAGTVVTCILKQEHQHGGIRH